MYARYSEDWVTTRWYHADVPTEMDSDGSPDSRTDRGSDLKARFERAIRGLQKPKAGTARRPLSPITIHETKERLFHVEQCARLGMSVEQMADFLPTWDLKLSRSTLYEYLQQLKLPRSYSPSMTGQSHHDYYTLAFFIRIAEDAHLAGHRTRKLLKGKVAWEGARFRPDFKFEVDRYLFFMEMQLSDLTETRWSVKFANYWRLKQESGLRFPGTQGRPRCQSVPVHLPG
jgi:hypothetical protein